MRRIELKRSLIPPGRGPHGGSPRGVEALGSGNPGETCSSFLSDATLQELRRPFLTCKQFANPTHGKAIDLHLPQEYDAAIQALACQPKQTGFYPKSASVLFLLAIRRLGDFPQEFLR